jgi:uncharacterized protein
MEQSILLFVIVGFIAQLIDGAIGMAYGISSTTFLLLSGVPSVVASGSVHIAEIFTTFVSGITHLKLGNIDKTLIKKIIFPGVLGVILGAYFLTTISGDKLRPYISIYLLFMGLRIIHKSIKGFDKSKSKIEGKKIYLLALAGGFFDAIGGGGWGPIVTTTLVAGGHKPRYTIGTVNLAEFFIAIAGGFTFILLSSSIQWKIVIGLMIGGSISAPFAALLCKKIPTKILMTMVGILITLLSIRTIFIYFKI